MKKLLKASVVLLLGLTYLVATPLFSSTFFNGDKAFADKRDVGHGKRDKAGK
ncbi:hypothetical protein G5V57_04530 [Nordella sp. HKS 07]|uniref:hypothetical protein n=1 Tax=Nordella sp. HKS 07 TaxID=2712222 RepID=UPI0013E17D7D|nr:hypothetical protein [Nordella sp. HKS 07]QIG47075.1 hypothetical protein G5V57_04530 [Nordella sp. HKS 07]